MAYLMGIDLGTSSVKVMVMDTDGRELALAGERYDIAYPHPNWAEQSPQMWWEKTIVAIRRALDRAALPPGSIAAVGFAAQMHGLVCLDRSGKVVRPAIIWADQRTSGELGEIITRIGRDEMARTLRNTVVTGFMLPSLYWLKRHEPENYAKIATVMLPKDYLKYRLTGLVVTDFSDAAATAAFDNVKLRWADSILDRLELDRGMFPAVVGSAHCLGTVTESAARETGLSTTTLVINGGADQAMQAIGNGIVEDGVYSANIGTGGQISTSMARPLYDPLLRTNTFAHALPGRWYIMGACLSSGASLKWFADTVLEKGEYSRLDEGAADVRPGSHGLLFLPYLTGERTPHLDPGARGVFCGLNPGHTRYHLARAIMEGVAFSLRDGFEILTSLGLPCRRLIASGGGSGSKLWMQIQADILEQEIYRSRVGEQACLGAIITAGVGAAIFGSFSEGCSRMVRLDGTPVSPIPDNTRLYDEMYDIYRDLYSANRDVFMKLERVARDTV